MSKFIRNTTIIFIIASLIIIPLGTSAMAQDSVEKEENLDAGLIAFDVLIVRPFGVGAILAGSFIFAVAYPFSYLTGQTEMTYQKLIKDPAKYTFKRPIGSFN